MKNIFKKFYYALAGVGLITIMCSCGTEIKAEKVVFESENTTESETLITLVTEEASELSEDSTIVTLITEPTSTEVTLLTECTEKPTNITTKTTSKTTSRTTSRTKSGTTYNTTKKTTTYIETNNKNKIDEKNIVENLTEEQIEKNNAQEEKTKKTTITTVNKQKAKTSTTTTKVEKYIVYKKSTHYIHMNTCHWVDKTCIKIESTEGLQCRRCSECKPNIEIVEEYKPKSDSSNSSTDKSFVKHFSRGTFYTHGTKGGSGRKLINCASGNGEVRGSIASSYLRKKYSYNYNGKRTKVYLEVDGYSSMNGYYYLDDSDAGNPNVIDFYFSSKSSCPFRRQGVVGVNCYIVK